MKRLINGCLIGVLLLGWLTSCGRQTPSATDLMALLLGDSSHPDVQIYFDGAAEDAEGWLSEEKMEALYGGYSPAALSDRYAIALCRDDRIYEIHLYYALDETSASQIEELLRGRLECLQQKDNYIYDPDSAAASAVVWKKGRWVCLLVTDNNQRAKQLLKKRI